MTLIPRKLRIDRETGMFEHVFPPLDESPKKIPREESLIMRLYPNFEAFSAMSGLVKYDGPGRVENARDEDGRGNYSSWNFTPKKSQLQLVYVDYSHFNSQYEKYVQRDEIDGEELPYVDKRLADVKHSTPYGTMMLNFVGLYVPSPNSNQREGRQSEISKKREKTRSALAFRPLVFTSRGKGVLARKKVFCREMILSLYLPVGEVNLDLLNFPFSINLNTREEILNSSQRDKKISEKPFESEVRIQRAPTGAFLSLLHEYELESQKWLRRNPDYQTPKARQRQLNKQ
jgi:hypothetical protein